MKSLLTNRFIRYIFFTSFGFINSLFMKFSNEIPNNDLIITGRGESLNVLKDNYELFSNLNHIMLINFCKNDFKNLNLNFLRNKIIHICVNITEDIIPINLLFRFTFGKILIARYENFRPNSINHKRKNYKANIYANKVKFYPEKMKEYWWLDNSGLLSMAYSLEILKIKNLYLFGFDFYQGDFHNSTLVQGFTSKKDSEEHKKAGLKLMKNFSKLIDQFPQTNFYLPDTHNFQVYNQKNVKKIKINSLNLNKLI